MLKARIFSLVIAITILFGFTSISQAVMLDFNDSSNLGVNLGGSTQWSGIGGGHLFMNDYNNDDYIMLLDSNTTVNSFEMNREPWQGYSINIAADWLVDIEAFDSLNTSIWTASIDLEAYDQWDEWITVDINTTNVASITFYATGDGGGRGFWPSIDNMVINESIGEPVPEPATLSLLGIGLVGLIGGAARKKLKKKAIAKT